MRWLVLARCFRVLAVMAALSAVFAFVSARGDRSWPTTPGRVLASRFVGVVSPKINNRGGAGGIMARWRVSYEYTVDGKTYRGRATTSYAWRSGEVEVYYHPSDPSISALDPGVDSLLLGVSIGVSALCFVLSRLAYGVAASS